jgi:hypothetical protein
MTRQTHPSKTTRQRRARTARRIAIRHQAIEEWLGWLADQNPTGYIVGSRTWEQFIEGVDAWHRTAPSR